MKDEELDFKLAYLREQIRGIQATCNVMNVLLGIVLGILISMVF